MQIPTQSNLRNWLQFAVVALLMLNCRLILGDEILPDERPNILWLTTEDIGPHLGCYNDPDAITPNLDSFAKRSLTYDLAWSNYPVCAPARTTIIAGMYACANAAGNMRSETIMPAGVEMFPHYLRESGYYCTNNSKTDYNFVDPVHEPWDESSNKAHWKNRKNGQPFFAVFNYSGTHESKIRSRPHQAIIDPASVRLAAYWPDTPEVRQDWAQYHDNITEMDKWFQNHLDNLKADGLTDKTIVLFYGDHGSGMPRHKRFAGDSGMRVPLIIHVPEKFRSLAPKDYAAGARTSRPIGFVDLAPTTLSTIGIKPPDFMQGHALMGPFETPAPKYNYGFRDRMDERPDISRSLRDQRFIYIKNYMPHLPAGQHIDYQFETATTVIWKRMFDAGQLNEVQSQFWQPRSPEELYDLINDPDETKNLVADPRFSEQLQRFRNEHHENAIRIGDLGLIPESIAHQFGLNQSRQLMLNDKNAFPIEKIFRTAELASNFDEELLPALVEAVNDTSASVRFWGAMGIMLQGSESVQANFPKVKQLVTDPEPSVAIVAAESLVKFGTREENTLGKERLQHFADLRNSNFYAALAALNAIDRNWEKTNFSTEYLDKLPVIDKSVHRGSESVGLLISRLLNQK